MPRFSMKSLLIATAVIALWFSTIRAYPGSDAIRSGINLMILVSSVVMTYCRNQRSRAFWIGVVTVLLTFHFNQLYRFTPEFDIEWAYQLIWNAGSAASSEENPFPDMGGGLDVPFRQHSPGGKLLVDGWMLVVAAMGGFIAAYIYDQSQQDKDG